MRELKEEDYKKQNEELFAVNANLYEQIRNLKTETESLKKEKNDLQRETESLKTELHNMDKKRLAIKEKAIFLRSVMIVEAVAIIGAIGVPNVQHAIQRHRGTNAIVSELEEANIILNDFKYITDDIEGKDGFSYTDANGEKVQNWNTSLTDFCSDIRNDALNDGYTMGYVAVALDAANFPDPFIEEITGYNQEQIKAEQMKAFYDMKIQEKGGIKK